MNKKIAMIGLGAVAVVMLVLAGLATTNAAESTFDFRAHRDQVQNAIESKDYNAWKQAIESRPRITDYVTQDNFDKFSQMHQLMQDGKYDEAKAIRSELGLPDKMGMGKGRQNRGMGNRINR